MFAKFDDFLNENQRATETGKLYSKFGQVMIILGKCETAFSERYQNRVRTTDLNTMLELQSVLESRVKEETGNSMKYFDLALAENIGTASLLMQDKLLDLPLNEVNRFKTQMLATKERLPTLVMSASLHEIQQIVQRVNRLGYTNENIHVVFNTECMNVELAESERIIPESIDFDGTNVRELLAMIESINLGDIYIAFNHVDINADIKPVREMQIKHRHSALKMSDINRFVLNHVVAKPQPSIELGLKEQANIPTLEGYKAYDFVQNETFRVFESSIFGRLVPAPTVRKSWDNLVNESVTYFDNGWKLSHDSHSVKLTNASNALRANQICEEIVISLNDAGYPLSDLITEHSKRQSDWTVDSVAKTMQEMNGFVTPEQLTATAFTNSIEAKRVYHPKAASMLRPATESVDTVGDLLKAVANKQFKEFVVETSVSDTKLDTNTIDSVMEKVVADGIRPLSVENGISFEFDQTTYRITFEN